MSRIPVQSVETAPKQARPMLEKLARRTGKPLNIHGEMAHAPVLLDAHAVPWAGGPTHPNHRVVRATRRNQSTDLLWRRHRQSTASPTPSTA